MVPVINVNVNVKKCVNLRKFTSKYDHSFQCMITLRESNPVFHLYRTNEWLIVLIVLIVLIEPSKAIGNRQTRREKSSTSYGVSLVSLPICFFWLYDLTGTSTVVLFYSIWFRQDSKPNTAK